MTRLAPGQSLAALLAGLAAALVITGSPRLAAIAQLGADAAVIVILARLDRQPRSRP